MKKRISGFTILLSSLLLLFPLAAAAQKTTVTDGKEKKEVKEEKVPLFNGIHVGVDISGAVGKALGSNRFSTEVQGRLDIRNRFFPAIEVGMGSTDATSESTQQHYKMTAPYFRIGADYNFLYKKTHLPGFLYGGLRYGFSSFTYDVDLPPVNDPTFGHTPISGEYHGISSSAHWLELVAGIHVKVFRNFCMGWSLRYKTMMSLKKGYNSEPWYIPGFGTNGKSGFGISYSLIYNIPLHL